MRTTPSPPSTTPPSEIYCCSRLMLGCVSMNLLCSGVFWCAVPSLTTGLPPPCPFSPCRRPQLIFWGRCVERNKKLPSPSCVCFFTMARLCLLSAPSLTLKSTAHSECLLKLSIHDPWLSLLNQGLIYAWITTFGLWIKKWGHIRISTGLAFCV